MSKHTNSLAWAYSRKHKLTLTDTYAYKYALTLVRILDAHTHAEAKSELIKHAAYKLFNIDFVFVFGEEDVLTASDILKSTSS